MQISSLDFFLKEVLIPESSDLVGKWSHLESLSLWSEWGIWSWSGDSSGRHLSSLTMILWYFHEIVSAPSGMSEPMQKKSTTVIRHHDISMIFDRGIYQRSHGCWDHFFRKHLIILRGSMSLILSLSISSLPIHRIHTIDSFTFVKKNLRFSILQPIRVDLYHQPIFSEQKIHMEAIFSLLPASHHQKE